MKVWSFEGQICNIHGLKMPDLTAFFFLIVSRERKPTKWLLPHIMADVFYNISASVIN